MSEKDVPKEQVKYVEVTDRTGLRWQTIAKSVRELDQEEIKEAKDDIDTLLVFAGLFSAVLSAFLVDTYKGLQPDPQQEMIFLLRQIANQNYTMTSSSSFSASSPVSPSDPPFTPAPLWALRVNGLWFASLILSLATASLGMLVKSWLREYLALDTEAPRERLRARYYREPGMQNWRVYEIAAMLPLLLQIALGLFFVGLCFFTASIDRRMGVSSLPLVTAWAFFLLFTIVCPLFWARCPFRIYALKNVLKHGRRLLRQLYYLVFTASRSPDGDGGEDEEDRVIKDEEKDVEVLIAADNMMADDSLIDAMGEALKQRLTPTREEIVTFAEGLILHRNGSLSKTLVSLGSKYYTQRPRHSTLLSTANAHSRAGQFDRFIASLRTLFSPQSSIANSPTHDPEPCLPSAPLYGTLPSVFPDLRMLSKRAYTSLFTTVADAFTIRINTDDHGLAKTKDVLTLAPIPTTALQRMRMTPRLGEDTWTMKATLLLVSQSHYSGTVKLDDSLVVPMCEAMKKIMESDLCREFCTPDTNIEFVLRVIQGYFAQSFGGYILPSIPDFSTLPKPAYEAIMSLAAQSVRGWRTQADIDSKWLNQACFLLVAKSRFALPDIVTDEVIEFICRSLQRRQTHPEIAIPSILRLLEHIRGVDSINNVLTSALVLDLTVLSKLSEPSYQDAMLIASHALRTKSPITSHAIESWELDASLLLVGTSSHFETIERRDQLIEKMCMIVEMDQSAQKSHIELTTVTTFVHHLLENHFRVSISHQPFLDDLPDLAAISSPAVYLSLMSIISRVVKGTSNRASQPTELDQDYWDFVNKATVLFLAGSPHSTSFRLDDELILIICQALSRSPLEPDASITFALRLIRRLTDTDVPLKGLSRILDVTSLTKKAYSSVMTFVASTLWSGCKSSLTHQSPQWVQDATILLLSKFPDQLPEKAVAGLQRSLDDTKSDIYTGGVVADILSDWAAKTQYLTPLSRPLTLVYDDASYHHRLDLESILRLYLKLILCVSANLNMQLAQRTEWLYPFLRANSRLFKNMKTRRLIEDLFNFLSHILLSTSSGDPTLERLGLKHALAITMTFGVGMARKEDVVQVFSNLWMTNGSSYYAMLLMAGIDLHIRLNVRDGRTDIIKGAFMEAKMETRALMLAASIEVSEKIGRVEHSYTGPQIDIIRLCYIHLHLYDHHREDTPKTHGAGSRLLSKKSTMKPEEGPVGLGLSDWRRLWDAIASALRVYRDDKLWSSPCEPEYWHQSFPNPTPEKVFELDCGVAKDCIDLMFQIDDNEENVDDGLFPDVLVVRLAQWISKETISQYPRLAHILERYLILDEEQTVRERPARLRRHISSWSGVDDNDAKPPLDDEPYPDETIVYGDKKATDFLTAQIDSTNLHQDQEYPQHTEAAGASIGRPENRNPPRGPFDRPQIVPLVPDVMSDSDEPHREQRQAPEGVDYAGVPASRSHLVANVDSTHHVQYNSESLNRRVKPTSGTLHFA